MKKAIFALIFLFVLMVDLSAQSDFYNGIKVGPKNNANRIKVTAITFESGKLKMYNNSTDITPRPDTTLQVATKHDLAVKVDTVNKLATKADIRHVLDTIQLVNYITTAELSDLVTADDLIPGLYYYITDRDWFLIANDVDILKPVSGYLQIFNGETLPPGVEPEVLYVQILNISGTSPQTVTMTHYSDYFIHYSMVNNLGDDINYEIRDNNPNNLLSICDIDTESKFIVPVAGSSSDRYDGYPINVTYTLKFTSASTINSNAVIVFHRSKF